MNKLKELTWKNHKEAERKSFAQKLIKGISPLEYYIYLYNQYMLYYALETRAAELLPEIKEIFRCEAMLKDLQELIIKYQIEKSIDYIKPVVQSYEQHVQHLDREGILAHIYVRHFGDMYGGQMIKKRVPGSGSMYDFKDSENLKQKIRSMLDDNMAEEANRCFKFAIRLFEELSNE